MSPGQCCYSIALYKFLIIVSVQGYLVLIDRVHFVVLPPKQHLLPACCFTIKRAVLIVIRRKAFSNHTLFWTFAALLLYFFIYLSIRIHLKARNSVMIFPPSSSFIRSITFLLVPMGSDLFSSFEYLFVSNLFSTSFAMSL